MEVREPERLSLKRKRGDIPLKAPAYAGAFRHKRPFIRQKERAIKERMREIIWRID